MATAIVDGFLSIVLDIGSLADTKKNKRNYSVFRTISALLPQIESDMSCQSISRQDRKYYGAR
jgi:hypothetical protein